MVWLLNQTPVQPLAKQRAIIAMANTLTEEQRLIQKLVSNGERMMSVIAKNLLKNKEVSL